MKVIILCLSHGYGGLELYVYREIKFLRASGVLCVPVVSEQSMLAEKLEKEGVKYETLNSGSKHLPIFTSFKLVELIKQNQIDVLHINWGKDLNLAAMAKYLSGNTVKLVYSRHMEITRSKKDLLHRWFYKQIDKFLVISRMVEENALTYLPLPRQKIELLYLGVSAPCNTELDCELFFKQFKINKSTMNIVLFGRIEKGKAQHVMISAMKELIETKHDISLAIIGHVMDEQYYADLVNSVELSSLSEYVSFTGMIDDASDKMPCFDVVCLTSPKETFGLVLAEAMRGGVAVIGTNAGGVVDIIDNEINGLLFEVDDPISLYEAICKLYENPDLRTRIAIEGKKKADSQFSEDTHFNKLIEHMTILCN